jgi:hypothetical protein
MSIWNLPNLRDQVEALHLTEAEEILFEDFLDPITALYMNIPVLLQKQYYDLSTLQALKQNPYTREPINLSEIQPAVELRNKFADVLQKLLHERAAKQAAILPNAPDGPKSTSSHLGIFANSSPSAATDSKVVLLKNANLYP